MKLEEIEKLCDAATPGPWGAFIEMGEDRLANLHGPTQYTEERFLIKDAEFIAASRELIPKLLAVAKAAKFVCKEDGSSPGKKELYEAIAELEK